MPDAIKHITDDIIFLLSGRQRTGAHALCVQHSPAVASLSTSFLLNHAPNSPELSRCVSMSRESQRLEKSSSDWLNCGNALIQHLSEKVRFSCFPVLPGSVEAQVT